MGGLLSKVFSKLGGGAGAGDSTGPSPNQLNKSGITGFEKEQKYTDDRWNDLKNAYVVHHQSVWRSFLMYSGQLWLDWDKSRKIWQPTVPADEWVPQPQINRYSPTIDAVVSNFHTIPEVEAIPTPADDPEAMMVAKVATELGEHIVKTQALRHQRGQKLDKVGLAAQLFVMTGGVFSKLYIRQKQVGSDRPVTAIQSAWGVTCPTCDSYTPVPQLAGDKPQSCPQCGGPVQIDDTEASMPSDQPGQPQSENEIVVDVTGSLYAFPRPGSSCLDDSPYLLWAQRRTLDFIYFNHDKFEADADAIWPDGYSVTYEHALNFWYTGYSSSSNQIKDSCMVLEMFIPPGKVKDFPDGFCLASANGKTVSAEKWDYPEHPITIAKYLDLPTIFFGRSIGFDLCELQKELCDYESIIKLHGMTSAVDPIVADMNAKVGEITGRADKVIWWRSIGPNAKEPKRLGAGHLDDGIYKQRDSLQAEFQSISMAVNAFRGEQEGAIVAASAISQLRSQAELMFSKPTQNWSGFWKETIRKSVVFIKKYYTMPQICSILGPGREQEVAAFMEADLELCLDWVASHAGLPKTRDERRQEFMLLWDKGALDLSDPAVRDKVHELFGETGMNTAFNKDATRARLENAAMKGGTEIHPMPIIEDLAVHLYFHKDAAKSLDFDKWSPASKQLMFEHIADTQFIMEQQAFATKQATAPVRASTGPKPKQGEGGPDEGGKGKKPPAISKADGQQGAAATLPSPGMGPGPEGQA